MDEVGAFLDELRRRVSGGSGAGQVVVATVVHSRGSTPRKPGAKMLIDPSGALLGTIGGGCGEAEVLSRAHRVLGTGRPETVEVSLLEEDGFDSPSICGGVLDVYLERVGADVGGIPRDDFYATLEEARVAGRGIAVVTLIDAPRDHPAHALIGRKTLVDDAAVQKFPFGDERVDRMARAQALEVLQPNAKVDPKDLDDTFRLYVESVRELPELVIVGAGHVGTAIARMGVVAGYVVTVLDDRSAFANPVRLPGVNRIIVADPRQSLASLPPRRDRHIVLVTRGHKLDAECLEIALSMDADYLGMIGSKRRVRRIREWLTERGAPADRLERLHAPIGLEIGAETPAEIAISILGEIVQERRKPRRRISRS